MPFKPDFTVLKSRQHIVKFLGIDEEIFERTLAFDALLHLQEEVSEDAIRPLVIPIFLHHRIPKKNGRGHRIVWEPFILKNTYKALARRLNNFFSHALVGFPHPRTFGYIGGRNIRENAQDHCGHRTLMSIDLKDFFPSIGAVRIAALLQSADIEPAAADLLSRFLTIGGSLPLGLPTSPTIANAICLPMDVELEALAQKYGATFSRYADDISFSGDELLPSLSEMSAIIERYGFEIAEQKTRISKLGQAHYVTGLSVSDPVQSHVPRKKKRRLRQELYFAGKYGLDGHFHRLGIYDPRFVQHEVNRLDGLVKFTAFHEPRQSRSLKTGWERILQESGWRPSFEPKNRTATPFSIYVDEAEYQRPDGSRILAMAMAVSQHQDQVMQATLEVLEDSLSDVWAAGDRAPIAKRGLHFSDAHLDLRLAYVERMRSLPFEGYVAMAQLRKPSEYQDTYIRLINSMIKRRLMAAESKLVSFIFEKNKRVSQEAIRNAVMDTYTSLRRSNNRCPENCAVGFSGKPNLGLSVPDFLLGVLGKFLNSGPDDRGVSRDRDEKLFERIRDKYRLILDVDSWTEYSRRREILPWSR